MIWLNQVIQGVLLGGYYALIACGLSFMFGVMRIINLSHGDLGILAAFLVWAIVEHQRQRDERGDQAAAFAKSEAADVIVKLAAFVASCRRIEAVQLVALAVDPVKPLFVLVPHRALAKCGLGVQHAFEAGHCASIPPPSYLTDWPVRSAKRQLWRPPNSVTWDVQELMLSWAPPRP